MPQIQVLQSTSRCNIRVSITYTDVGDRSAIQDGSLKGFLDGALIVLANFLLETKEQGVPLEQTAFPAWMQQHREIRSVLSRKTLD